MLPLRRQLVILGYRRPLIWQDFDMALTRINHGFDGERHAFLKHHACARSTIVQDLWVVVKYFGDTVTAELPHDTVMVTFRVPLNGLTDIRARDVPVRCPYAFLRNC